METNIAENKLAESGINAPYPRVIAHRGASMCCPENTLPSFMVAVVSGADEIELDVCTSLDGELVVSHDPSVDRISDGTGNIAQMNWDEIKKLDVGRKKGPEWENTGFCRFEEVLALLARKIIMNIHVKNDEDYNEQRAYERVKKIIQLLKKYNCPDFAYIAGDRQILAAAIDIDDRIERCCLERRSDKSLIDHAIEYKCNKLQFFKPALDEESIKRAHENNITCNVFWSDEPEETKNFLKMGIDSILTNNIMVVGPVIKRYRSQ